MSLTNEQAAVAPARPTERGSDDPNAALYARLQARHEEYNAAYSGCKNNATIVYITIYDAGSQVRNNNAAER